MSPDTITVVSGLARCGSSLVMRMLHVAGMEPYCPDNDRERGLGRRYEATEAFELPGNSDWLLGCRGKAVKLLIPDVFVPPSEVGGEPLSYDVIWVDRDLKQQARSHLKHWADKGECVVDRSSRAVRERMAQLRYHRKRSLKVWSDMPRTRVLKVSFEGILSDPRMASFRLLAFLGRDPCDDVKVERMADQVLERSPESLPYMAEYTMAMGYRGALN